MPRIAADDFLVPDGDGIVRVPILVKGRLRFPPDIGIDALRSGAAESHPLNGAQAIRLPVYEPATFRPTGEHEHLLFARPDPRELVEEDLGKLHRELFSLPVNEVLAYVGELRKVLSAERDA